VPSSLAPDGEAGWSNVATNASADGRDVASARLHVAYEHVDWAMLRGAYGWAGSQWQAWARGELVVEGGGERVGARPVELWVEHALELCVDGRSVWGGDFFGFQRAPVVLWLVPGRHVVEIRLVRDVRSMGGVDVVPAVDVALEVREVDSVLTVREGSVLVSDVVDGRLPSPLATVSITNAGIEWIQVVDIVCNDVSPILFNFFVSQVSEYCTSAAWLKGPRIMGCASGPWTDQAPPIQDKDTGPRGEDILVRYSLPQRHPTTVG
jgi:hypothetical protein